ncbi:MAG: TorF family putative porin [Pseudomonadota bacterium]
MNKQRLLSAAAGALVFTFSATASAGEWTANAAASNNYIWRGLTQSENEAAVSGGIDFAADNGFYAGTWASNVSYAPGDVFSYEHDVYFGFAGEAGDISYDFGYLYYNYDSAAEFDFGEIYGSIGFGAFSLGLNILANTEADEGPGQDFGFGEAFYISADYATEVGDNGVELGFHVGYHDGDFNEAFNGVPDSYVDYNVSLAKDGFMFMISGTDLDDTPTPDNLDNDEIKFVVSYSVEFDL